MIVNTVGKSARRLAITSLWLENLYWISLLMSFHGFFAASIGFSPATDYPAFATILIATAEIGLIGSIYFPFSFITKYMRGHHVTRAQWFCAVGSMFCIPVLAFWLSKQAESFTLITVLIASVLGAPLLAYLLAYLKTKQWE